MIEYSAGADAHLAKWNSIVFQKKKTKKNLVFLCNVKITIFDDKLF